MAVSLPVTIPPLLHIPAEKSTFLKKRILLGTIRGPANQAFSIEALLKSEIKNSQMARKLLP